MNAALLELRPAADEDSEFCYQVKKAALGEYVAQVWGWSEEFQLEFHRNDFALKRPDIVIYAGQAVGTLAVIRHEEHFHVAEFYLLPEFQRQGIGSALLERVQAQAREAGLVVRLEVLKVNPARRFYERHGFSVYDENEHHYFMINDKP